MRKVTTSLTRATCNNNLPTFTCLESSLEKIPGNVVEPFLVSISGIYFVAVPSSIVQRSNLKEFFCTKKHTKRPDPIRVSDSHLSLQLGCKNSKMGPKPASQPIPSFKTLPIIAQDPSWPSPSSRLNKGNGAFVQRQAALDSHMQTKLGKFELQTPLSKLPR